MDRTLLGVDATNRAFRTFLTGLFIDVAVGVALVLAAYFSTAEQWGDLEWAILGFSLAKSIVQAVCAFVLRRFLDPSRFPTPLPPAPQPQPAEPVTDAGNIDPLTAAVLIFIFVVILVVLTRYL